MTGARELDGVLALDRRTGPAAMGARALPALMLLAFGFVALAGTSLGMQFLLIQLVCVSTIVLLSARAPLGGLRLLPLVSGLVLLIAVFVGGTALALAPATVVAAVIWSDCDHRRVWPDRDGFVGVAAALLLGFVLSGLVAGPLAPRRDPGSQPVQPAEQFVRREPTAESSFIERIVRAIVEFLTGGEEAVTSSDSGSGATPPPPQSDPMAWRDLLLALMVLAITLAVALLLWRLARRWLSGRVVRVGVFDLVRRFDRVGARVVRDRRASEGVVDYGSSVSAESGDRRVARTGELISDVLYNPRSVTESEATVALDELEADPPSPVRRSWRRRFRS